MLHTHAVTTVRFEGKPLDEKVLLGVHNYFNIYMLLLTLSVLLLSLDGFDIVSTFTAVLTCFNNVGPGLEMVGPHQGINADFSAPASAAARRRNAGRTAGAVPHAGAVFAPAVAEAQFFF